MKFDFKIILVSFLMILLMYQFVENDNLQKLEKHYQLEVDLHYGALKTFYGK